MLILSSAPWQKSKAAPSFQGLCFSKKLRNGRLSCHRHQQATASPCRNLLVCVGLRQTAKHCVLSVEELFCGLMKLAHLHVLRVPGDCFSGRPGQLPYVHTVHQATRRPCHCGVSLAGVLGWLCDVLLPWHEVRVLSASQPRVLVTMFPCLLQDPQHTGVWL